MADGRRRPENLLSGIRKVQDPERENLWSPCSDCSSGDENNSPTAINSFNWDKPAMEDKTVDFGWSSTPTKANTKKSLYSQTESRHKKNGEKSGSGYVNFDTADKKFPQKCTKSEMNDSTKQELDLKQGGGNVTSESIYPDFSKNQSDTKRDPNPSPDERTDEDIEKEKEELRNVAWFQAGIPREIALEVLSEQPEGSFIVRSSTTKPNCYALSLRVPSSKNPTGIAHYLILHTAKGYKIKGFTKEFSSLSALITHHSVMPELLPCTLNLCRPSTRDAEREFEDTEQKKCDIFSDIHWLMTDIEPKISSLLHDDTP
ncbi:hypothetical protein JTE90_004859 [Oedothorax gibbosus]|uniref:SH2 domain-containing protein n=1 Tax=Oedothorax gibbosus TaxID=931172 RepID=A0AAV6UTE5_9ARAC|nr:hypothetical protein JTE90_004859 [Oedothorax gibbosus]